MSKHSQDRIPRLAVVGPTNSRHSGRAAGPQWWGPRRAQLFDAGSPFNNQQGAAKTVRIAAGPPRWTSRSAQRALTSIWKFVCSYFVSPTGQRQGAVVLSFRRYAMQAHGLRGMTAAPDFTGKKNNGSVGWQSDHHGTPQEGGRR